MGKHVEKTIVGFEIALISLQDAKNMAISGSGNYSEIKAELLALIPKLQPEQSFVFGLPKGKNGKLSDKEIKDVRMSINKSFKTAEIPWKVIYSKSEKKFVGTPAIDLALKKRRLAGNQYSSSVPMAEKLVEIAHQLFGKQLSSDHLNAICKVGRGDFNIAERAIEELIGIKHGGAWYRYRKAPETESVSKLRAATKGLKA